MLGTTLWNRYKIKQFLGSGGFGNTYVAIDLGLPGQPYCVVKHLKPKDPPPNRAFDRKIGFHFAVLLGRFFIML